MEENRLPAESGNAVQFCSAATVSPEIVEIGEEREDVTAVNDVYVAVGKEDDDLDVLKWALDHCCLFPGSRVFLVHIFPPITYINTPVGRLSRNQLNQDQVRVYVNEENNRRRNTLQKYIRLCADAKVNVDTVLIEHKSVTKAILALIPVLNINKLVMGMRRAPYPRLIKKKQMKGEIVRNSAPDYCNVIIVYDGQENPFLQKPEEPSNQLNPSALSERRRGSDHYERKFFELGCFSGCRPNARDVLQSPKSQE
ncbi:hypothetical protein MLD38_012566 [Melastoma candidum]|uniref:Uncharacterized protein n=1 Tax=Melastoma candidum TaxID=119954 RepID=A0ACB9R9U0_9MYRT|nr:hypothetical protein MLD38_012566 [Melastoma candidum]